MAAAIRSTIPPSAPSVASCRPCIHIAGLGGKYSICDTIWVKSGCKHTAGTNSALL